MKKYLLLSVIVFSLNAFSEDFYCPPKIECKNMQCSGMQGYHFTDQIPGLDGTYYFDYAFYNGNNPMYGGCHYTLIMKDNTCEAYIYNNNPLVPDEHNYAPGNNWHGENGSQYWQYCRNVPYNECPFTTISKK